jgi:hypothetical protein
MGSPIAIGSTLMTLAPCSASIIEARDAVIIVENSSTVIVSSGFISTPSFFYSIAKAQTRSWSKDNQVIEVMA